MQEILQSPVTKAIYPKILSNYSILNQLDNFCECSVSKRSNETKLKKRDSVAWKFYDRKIIYQHVDLCALTTFEPAIHSTYYSIIFLSQFHNIIDQAVDDYYTKAIRHIASVNSYNDHIRCIKNEIRVKCSKVKSMRLTYSCIKHMIGDYKQVRKLEEKCPSFRSKESELLPETIKEEFI